MSPFELIALKQRVGAEYTAEVELFVLIRLDAAKRRQLDGVGFNFISHHLVQAQYIMARLKQPDLLKVVLAAGNAWIKAGARDTLFLDLTTGEYKAVCAGLAAYFRILPRIERNTYLQAMNVAEQAMK